MITDDDIKKQNSVENKVEERTSGRTENQTTRIRRKRSQRNPNEPQTGTSKSDDTERI